MDQLVISGGVPLPGPCPYPALKIPLSQSSPRAYLRRRPDPWKGSRRCRTFVPSSRFWLIWVSQWTTGAASGHPERPDPWGARGAYELVRTMRASFLVLGPLLARLGRARVSLPGGCAIGARPVDQHLAGLKRLGAELEVRGGWRRGVRTSGASGGTVGDGSGHRRGTEHLLMAAVCARGSTVLENAAEEPEIVDLAAFLRTLGAKIDGEGSARIEIEGVEALSVPAAEGPVHSIMADRIEAASYLIAGAATRGSVTAEGIDAAHLGAVLDKLEEAGARVERVRAR